MSGHIAGCVFCERIQHRRYAPASPGTRVVMFEPLHPVTPGHMLFVPREHASSAATDPDAAGAAVTAAARYAAGTECNLITSVGPSATQTVYHLHVHYIPRHAGDGLALPWTERAV